MPDAKAIVRKIITTELMSRILRPVLLGASATIFTLHRFADPDGDPNGTPAEELRQALAYLRRQNFELLPLGELVLRLQTGKPLSRPAAVFTVDDGYFDFAEVAAPVFAAFDCPVTVFLTTGFIDGEIWLWWDKIHYAFSATTRSALDLTAQELPLQCAWSDAPQRQAALDQVTEALKLVDDARKERLIDWIAAALEVELPRCCPDRYRSMNWRDVRHWAMHGVTFGPHTVTHPILARVPDSIAAEEIKRSWSRLRSETEAALPIFCYPNGDRNSFGERERQLAAGAGLIAGVTTKPRHITARDARTGGEDYLFQLPRFAFPDWAGLLQTLNGMERTKAMIRSFIATQAAA